MVFYTECGSADGNIIVMLLVGVIGADIMDERYSVKAAEDTRRKIHTLGGFSDPKMIQLAVQMANNPNHIVKIDTRE